MNSLQFFCLATQKWKNTGKVTISDLTVDLKHITATKSNVHISTQYSNHDKEKEMLELLW